MESSVISMRNPFLILYGSETGNAEEVAFKLHQQFSRHGHRFSISSIDEYDVSLLPSEKFIVWIVATAGEGEVPSSMKKFWKFLLRKSLSAESLQGVSSAVFGLGDSSYEKFNSAARRLSKRLQQLGSKDLIPIGLGDDQSKYGYFTELDSWIAKLLPVIHSVKTVSSSPVPLCRMDESLNRLDHYEVTVINTSASDDALIMNDAVYKKTSYQEEEFNHLQNLFTQPDGSKRLSCQNTSAFDGKVLPIIANVKENSRMTAPSWDQDVRRIVLSLPTRQTNVTANSSSFKDTEVAAETAAAAASLITNNAHIAGDVAVIYPENSPKLVSRLISIIQETDSSLNADTKLSIKCLPGHIKRKSRLGEVKMCTLGRLLSSFLDIGGLPQRGFFEGLALHTSNEEEKEKLTELSSAEGTDLYYDYCVREKRNYIEALEDFRSARPCLAKLLELLPLLQPRHYSIANSGMVCQDEVHLCVAVASSKTPYGRVRVGVCSSYLSSLSPGDQVVLWIRSGSFKMPIKDPVSTGDDQPPLILVGPGTGVAPMRALLQERKAAHKNQEMSGIPQLRTILFFGCRKRESDFLYSDEITNSTQNGNDEETKDPDVFISPSSTVVVAFSRDQAKKVYVTHKIEEHGASVWGLLQQGASVFISGSAKNMPADVRKSIMNVIRIHGNKTEDEARSTLQLMERNGKYVVEAWS